MPNFRAPGKHHRHGNDAKIMRQASSNEHHSENLPLDYHCIYDSTQANICAILIPATKDNMPIAPPSHMPHVFLWI